MVAVTDRRQGVGRYPAVAERNQFGRRLQRTVLTGLESLRGPQRSGLGERSSVETLEVRTR